MSAVRHMRREDDVDLDYSDRAGFLTGRAAAMADWQAKRESKQYDALFKRLYARNWARKMRREGGARLERARARARAWKEANREHMRSLDRARRAKKRTPRVITCEMCSAKRVVRALRKDSKRPRWCSRKCSNTYWTKHRKPRSRGLRNMRIESDIRAALADGPRTLGEMRIALPHAKPGSLATKLCTMAQQGVLVRRGPKKGATYALCEKVTS